MTEVKKTTTRTRKTPEKKTEPEVVEQEVVEEKKEAVKVAEKRVIKDTDRIEVMNNTTGRYGYYGTNGFSFDLEDYGDTLAIPMQELRTMASGQHKIHLRKAWILILDKDVIKELNLESVYENIYSQKEVDELLRDAHRLKEAFPKMKDLGSMQEVFIKRARQKVQDGESVDWRVVNLFKELTNIDITQK